jgi:hypothetical protein
LSPEVATATALHATTAFLRNAFPSPGVPRPWPQSDVFIYMTPSV